MSQRDLEVQQPKLEVRKVQLATEESWEVVVECPDHTPCNFVKGKPGAL
jgi:hypothetical protein